MTLARQAWLDRDFVLTVADVQSASLAVVAQDGDGCVALASFCVDAQPAANDRPLALKLLVDCSGSMAGDSITAARRALQRILTALTPADRFSLTRFGSDVADVVPALVSADPRAVVAAAAAVANMQADLGGTEMCTALATVFAREGSTAGADVLLITDGEVWGLDRLIGQARAARQRVFVVGIGAAPAESVLRKLAQASGGACEFVTPGEDAEGAIVRMFARLRSPRIARVDVQWPVPPLWTTPLPTGLFGGETVHALAGFTSPATGEALLALIPADKSGPLTTRVALPTDISADTTLARMAAMRQIEVADRKTQLDLALRYGLLTERTNFIVVHERAEGEKARDLPELRRIAQMHAAGWGGVGSVHQALAPCELLLSAVFERCAAAPPPASSRPRATCAAPSPTVSRSLDWMRTSVNRHEPAPSPFGALLTQLERRVSLLRPNALPATIADLEHCGLDAATAQALRSIVAEGLAEADVVRAFLEALAPFADKAHHSRQLRRALRRQFADAVESAELRHRVRPMVTSS